MQPRCRLVDDREMRRLIALVRRRIERDDLRRGRCAVGEILAAGARHRLWRSARAPERKPDPDRRDIAPGRHRRVSSPRRGNGWSRPNSRQGRQRKAFKDIEEFDDMHAARGRRRHRDDVVAAIRAAYRLALDGAVGFQIARRHHGRPRRARCATIWRRRRPHRRRSRRRGRPPRSYRRDPVCVSLSPRASGAPSGWRKILALEGQRASRCVSASESARSSSTVIPSRARRTAGATSSASENLPEP